jgi:glucose-1-phosphate cytidylyltransferase
MIKGLEVVILCGGKGTRSYPFTEYFPKVMMPVAGTPILVHIMRLYADHGVTRFVLAAGHRQEVLLDYFEGRFPDWDIVIVDTGAESDTGERVRRCAPHVGDTFFTTYGDGLGDVDLHALLAFHRQAGGLATVTAVPLRSQYGVVVFDPDGRVETFREKPIIPDFWINAGFFVFDRRVFDEWQGKNLEVEVLPHLAARQQLHAYRHTGFWKSMDSSKDQQEMERLYNGGSPPWAIPSRTTAPRIPR